MIQESQALYDTVYATTPGSSALIITIQPESINPNTVQAILLLSVGTEIVNNNEMFEGELMMALKNTLKNIDYEIDDEGNLIIHAPDADNYSIDSEGYLIYTWR